MAFLVPVMQRSTDPDHSPLHLQMHEQMHVHAGWFCGYSFHACLTRLQLPQRMPQRSHRMRPPAPVHDLTRHHLRRVVRIESLVL
ncbi:hypothetical protein FGD71_017895 [Streptomyces sporangiiformans]|uniref:Uncharacterized protein n=1 Tax=Streptomyces sporangiiformans TaxID=2315329 RepID=A0A505DEE6_9ACTN|nr:hypothetical protein FGD71_017895 [Streptomyces sporangiiformans]